MKTQKIILFAIYCASAAFGGAALCMAAISFFAFEEVPAAIIGIVLGLANFGHAHIAQRVLGHFGE